MFYFVLGFIVIGIYLINRYKLKKATDEASKSIEETNKDLDKMLKKAGLDPKDFEG